MAEYIQKQSSVEAQQWDGTPEGVTAVADFAYEALGLGYIKVIKKVYGKSPSEVGSTHILVFADRAEKQMCKGDYLYVKKDMYGRVEEVDVLNQKEFEIQYEAKE